MSRPRFRLPVPDRLSAEVGDWRRRVAILAGAVAIGLVALLFARAGDLALQMFEALAETWFWLPLILTPAIYVLCAWLTRVAAAEAAGSGIPQVVAAIRQEHGTEKLFSLKAGFAKISLTVLALLGGASVGREGPTVQVGAAIMTATHRWAGAAVRRSVLIAGGAAGVSAAFNTPLAGIAFAIEELAIAYEQRMAALVMGAVIIAGMTAQGIAGDYIYFGNLEATLPLHTALIVAPAAGLAGGGLGGLFSRLLLWSRKAARRTKAFGSHPMLLALACGVVVAVIGVATGGLTWGTGYEPAREALEGQAISAWLGPAKFVATLATALSGIPGGIFAPSLAVGAGFGEALTWLFPDGTRGAIVMLGMVAYFTGVVRAPLTAVIILSETTGNIGLLIPLFAAALIADWAGAMVCPERLYHALARDFLPEPEPQLELDGNKAGKPAS
ncbi:chloride channel protein [Croceicoccus naphthovorans]|uniref:Chloride channel protein n=1 Tax=Croceicoccus naphthovorans TaxID=1348774 RepID=A0A0G3XCN2_9SPHN|nr:chloride channel protein [Croceicoccus naphthovorans]AKM08947.1 chloride channel protein [Croceicoccus naphthovorans]MBB3989264.1 H+/Cl- antiporter ClcA [Croceicoccus naphthovorans]